MFTSRYDKYFIKNVDFVEIPNWNLFTVNYNGIKLARFYDKNIKSVLKHEIYRFISTINKNKDKPASTKKLKKLVLKHFSQTYGKPLILESLSGLTQKRRFN